MHTGVDRQVYYKLANAPLLPFPFPHLVAEEVFPPAFYATLREHLPPREAMKSLKELKRVTAGYPDGRYVLPLDAAHLAELRAPLRDFWGEVARWMLSGAFANLMLNKFSDTLHARLGDWTTQQFQHEAMLVQDYTAYSLGPHTDGRSKVLSLLFYLPADATRPHLGTSLYVPKDVNFRCEGGPHHPYEQFRRVYTTAYRPNTLFAFPKSDYSFHGVEPVEEADVRRDLLLYDIMVRNPAAPAAGPAAGNFR